MRKGNNGCWHFISKKKALIKCVNFIKGCSNMNITKRYVNWYGIIELNLSKCTAEKTRFHSAGSVGHVHYKKPA